MTNRELSWKLHRVKSISSTGGYKIVLEKLIPCEARAKKSLKSESSVLYLPCSSSRKGRCGFVEEYHWLRNWWFRSERSYQPHSMSWWRFRTIAVVVEIMKISWRNWELKRLWIVVERKKHLTSIMLGKFV